MFSQFGSPNHKVCILLPSYGAKVLVQWVGIDLSIGLCWAAQATRRPDGNPLREVQTGLRNLADALHDWNVNNQA
jgi:hypothetical protein